MDAISRYMILVFLIKADGFSYFILTEASVTN